MQVVKKIILFIVYSLWFMVFSLNTAFAEGEFATSYDISYVVGTDGVTDVTQKITLKNLTTQYYASSFSLNLSSTQIFDITAFDAAGPLELETKKQGIQTSITVKFNQQIAGKDRLFPWTLRFKSRDFASKQGKIWQVSTPKIALVENLDSYNLRLSIPISFGEATAISPKPVSSSIQGSYRNFTFSKEVLLQSGVSADFGTLQLFEFNLIYPLENSTPTAGLVSMAIPPNTAFQDVIYNTIDPQPINVTVDSDGNYLAWYKLGGRQKINVSVSGLVKLYNNSKVKNPSLPESLKLKYLQPQKYWEKDHPVIKTKLSEILGTNSPKTNYEKARLVHRAVVNLLKYDGNKINSDGIERFGAVTALANPNSAVCMEFTDLFIALSRAAGIPARELNGYAYTPNLELRPLSLSKDILHAWPEFWDKERGWVMVDPTWENTTGGVDYFNKFDLNHFVMAIKGSSSTEPILGAKNVKVEFSEALFQPGPKLEVKILTPQIILSGFPNKLKIKLQNSGNSLQQSSDLSVKSSKITILGSSPETGLIPAYGQAEFEYDLRTKTLLDDYQDVVEVTVAGQKIKKEIEVKPLIIFRNFPLAIFGLIGLISLIYFSVLGGLIIRRRILKISAVNVNIKNKSKKPAS